MMVKTLIIIILILVILGLYFAPQVTKALLKKTGQATASVAKDVGEKIADSEKVQDIKGKLTEGPQTKPEQKE